VVAGLNGGPRASIRGRPDGGAAKIELESGTETTLCVRRTPPGRERITSGASQCRIGTPDVARHATRGYRGARNAGPRRMPAQRRPGDVVVTAHEEQ
jgi:hypothetical protein